MTRIRWGHIPDIHLFAGDGQCKKKVHIVNAVIAVSNHTISFLCIILCDRRQNHWDNPSLYVHILPSSTY